MIRAAKFVDTMRIVELIEEMCAKSRYEGIDSVDRDHTRQLVSQFIQRHGNTHHGGSLVNVAVRDMKVEGFMAGFLQRTYAVGKRLCAEDVFLYLSDKADPKDAVRLIDAYIDWAESNPKVVEIKLSYTDALPDADRIGGLYERKGFRACGRIYTRDNLLMLEAAE